MPNLEKLEERSLADGLLIGWNPRLEWWELWHFDSEQFLAANAKRQVIAEHASRLREPQTVEEVIQGAPQFADEAEAKVFAGAAGLTAVEWKGRHKFLAVNTTQMSVLRRGRR